MSANWEEDAIQQVKDASIPLFIETKAQNVAMFKKEFKSRGKDSWRKHIVEELEKITGMKPKNLERRFDPTRLGNLEKRNANQYKTLGQRFGIQGYKAPPGGYHVSYKGGVYFSHCEKRDIDLDITGRLADELAEDPTKIFDIMLRIWLEEESEEEASKSVCTSDGVGDPTKIEITANGKPEEPPKEKKKKRTKKTPFEKE